MDTTDAVQAPPSLRTQEQDVAACAAQDPRMLVAAEPVTFLAYALMVNSVDDGTVGACVIDPVLLVFVTSAHDPLNGSDALVATVATVVPPTARLHGLVALVPVLMLFDWST